MRFRTLLSWRTLLLESAWSLGVFMKMSGTLKTEGLLVKALLEVVLPLVRSGVLGPASRGPKPSTVVEVALI